MQIFTGSHGLVPVGLLDPWTLRAARVKSVGQRATPPVTFVNHLLAMLAGKACPPLRSDLIVVSVLGSSTLPQVQYTVSFSSGSDWDSITLSFLGGVRV